MNEAGRTALAIYLESLEQLQPDRLLARAGHFSQDGIAFGTLSYRFDNYRRVFVCGAGKASCGLASALMAGIGTRVDGGLVITKKGSALPLGPVRVLEASHPIPDESSIKAGEAMLRFAKSCREGDLTIFLLSGGASALMEVPTPPIDAEKLALINRELLARGLPIEQMNVLRIALSQIKGGKLGLAFGRSTVICLFLNDILSGSPHLVGSGPLASFVTIENRVTPPSPHLWSGAGGEDGPASQQRLAQASLTSTDLERPFREAPKRAPDTDQRATIGTHPSETDDPGSRLRAQTSRHTTIDNTLQSLQNESGREPPSPTAHIDLFKQLLASYLPDQDIQLLLSERSDDPNIPHVQLASINDALEFCKAAAERKGLKVSVASRLITGEARDEAIAFVSGNRLIAKQECMIAGGEPIVTLRGQGRGGRCQEFATASALEISGRSDVALLAGSTDGSDGPTNVGAALVDGTSANSGTIKGVTAQSALQESDSFRFLSAANGLIRTGPTQCNVNDLYILVRF